MNVPPHELEYQNQSAPVPVVPPEMSSEDEFPRQMIVWLPETIIAAVELSLTVIVTLEQLVVLHIPSALAKYVEVCEGLTTNDKPLPKAVPPHEPLNQNQLAEVPKIPPETEIEEES